ncbi:MAG: glucosyl-3-phosphoglycerate synthase [Actinomycetota bacterium]
MAAWTEGEYAGGARVGPIEATPEEYMVTGSNEANEFPWLTGLAQRWHRRRTFGARNLPSAGELAARKLASGERISVVLPALNEAATIGPICSTIQRRLMERTGLVDELLVVDCASDDGTPDIAADAGATVHDVSDLVPEMPVVRGKGEALWRSLSVVHGDIVVWVDSDIRNFSTRFVTRLVAPILTDPTVSYVKGFYRRPVARGEELIADEGGRVTELLARPMLAALFPELSGIVQPLAGEYAGHIDILKRIPFFTGYSVEIGLLIDLLDAVGLDAMAQVDLDERVHRNRPLTELSPMAYAIGKTILRRAEERGRIRSVLDVPLAPLLRPSPDGIVVENVQELERPPMESIGTDHEPVEPERRAASR